MKITTSKFSPKHAARADKAEATGTPRKSEVDQPGPSKPVARQKNEQTKKKKAPTLLRRGTWTVDRAIDKAKVALASRTTASAVAVAAALIGAAGLCYLVPQAIEMVSEGSLALGGLTSRVHEGAEVWPLACGAFLDLLSRLPRLLALGAGCIASGYPVVFGVYRFGMRESLENTFNIPMAVKLVCKVLVAAAVSYIAYAVFSNVAAGAGLAVSIDAAVAAATASA